MKCKLITEVQRGLESAADRAAFKETGKLPTVAAGTEIEHGQAYLLVASGLAEAADDECREALGLAVAEKTTASAEKTDPAATTEQTTTTSDTETAAATEQTTVAAS